MVRKVERRKSIESGKEAVKLGIEHSREFTAFANCYGYIFQSGDLVVGNLCGYFQSRKLGR